MSHHHRWSPLFITLLATCWLSATNASEKPTTVYTGTLGNQSVVFDFAAHNEISGSSYFYTRYHRALELDGNFDAAHLALREGSEGGNTRPLITLDRQADGGWRGNWQGPHGKSLPIVLHPAKPTPPARNAPLYLKQLYSSNTFEYLRLASLKPQAGKRERFMGYTLQWWRIPNAGTASFEILDGYPDAERQRINRALMDRMWRETNAHYDCIEGPGWDNSNTYDETVTPRMLTSSLVSVTVFTSYFCGGAHPDSTSNAINLDAHSAKPLTLEDILWVGKGSPLHYTDDESLLNSPIFDTYANYRENTFSPWLIQQWKHLYPKEMLPAQGDDDCDYTYGDSWRFVSWYMTPKGVFVIPEIDGAERVCRENDDWSVLPWRVVRKHPGRLKLVLPE